MFEKALKWEIRSTMVYVWEKKIDKDAICPINGGRYVDRVPYFSYLTNTPF